MGIEKEDFRLFSKSLTNRKERGGRLLILGNAKVFVTWFDVRKDIESSKDHSAKPLDQTLTLEELGEVLGFDGVDTLDLNGKATYQLNLCLSLPRELIGKYSAVWDAGVLFWCFDIAAAIMNIYRLVNVNGFIVHTTAITGHFGAGYYNPHPMMFRDFYRSNEAEFIAAEYRVKSRSSLISRLFRKVGVQVTPSKGQADDIFLRIGKADQLSFGESQLVPESLVLPNRSVGVLVYKKTGTLDPRVPFLLGD